jgi:hypothetical protein
MISSSPLKPALNSHCHSTKQVNLEVWKLPTKCVHCCLPQLEIKPFTLHLLPAEEAHLCPIGALSEWLIESKITTGYLFRKIASGDRIAVNENRPMVCILF